MLVGLARTFTFEPVASLNGQTRDLEAYGCRRVFIEQVSSQVERKQLETALGILGTADKLVVTKLECLARSVQHLGQIIERVNSAGASLVVLDMDGAVIDTSKNISGKMILKVISSVAQFERKIMLERRSEGIAKAKADGKYNGRKPTARAKTNTVKLALDKGTSKAQICRELDISKTSLYRIIGELKR